MKKIIYILASLLTLIFINTASAQVHVQGYTKKDGTYVAPHYRSKPNNTVRDNYNYKGNVNPYTGSKGINHYRNSPSSEYYNRRGKTNQRQRTNKNSYSNRLYR